MQIANISLQFRFYSNYSPKISVTQSYRDDMGEHLWAVLCTHRAVATGSVGPVST